MSPSAPILIDSSPIKINGTAADGKSGKETRRSQGVDAAGPDLYDDQQF